MLLHVPRDPSAPQGLLLHNADCAGEMRDERLDCVLGMHREPVGASTQAGTGRVGRPCMAP